MRRLALEKRGKTIPYAVLYDRPSNQGHSADPPRPGDHSRRASDLSLVLLHPNLQQTSEIIMSGPIPLELQSKIANWRLRAAEGTLTLDEMKEAITYLRAGRIAASQAAGAAKRGAAAAKRTAPPPQEDMLSELEGL